MKDSGVLKDSTLEWDGVGRIDLEKALVSKLYLPLMSIAFSLNDLKKQTESVHEYVWFYQMATGYF